RAMAARVHAMQAGAARPATEAVALPLGAVVEHASVRQDRRVAIACKADSAGSFHRAAVAPVEIALPRSRRPGAEATTEVAGQVGTLAVPARVDAPDVARRCSEGDRSGRGRCGRKHEPGDNERAGQDVKGTHGLDRIGPMANS